MDSTTVKHNLQSLCHMPGENESSINRLQRQFQDLEKRVDKYFDDLVNAEQMCEQAKADMEWFKLKAQAKKWLVKKIAEYKQSCTYL